MSKGIVQFTEEQDAAINYRGGSLLVSAAAGSGKTKVLVERLLSRIDDGDNIDEFLVITYTRAAAFELRERIHEELLTRLANSPGNMRLRRQVMLCKGASIDTIHTFCSEILRENAHLVRLPPDFRISDESESTLIMTEVSDAVINEAYEKIHEDDGFSLLVDTVAEGRDDKRLSEVLLDIYRKLQSTPDPSGWLEQKINEQTFDGVNDISETKCGLYMLNKLRETVGYCKDELKSLIEEADEYAEFKEKYADSLNELLSQVLALFSSFDHGWDEARSFSDIEFTRPRPVKGYEKFKDTRTRCIKELKKCIEELKISSAEHLHDMQSLSLAIISFYELLQKFDAAYSEEKRRRGVADFSDLEHMTLFLLTDKETGKKTDIAANISGRYKEIMIDEYQDVNEVQEYIFTLISKNKENIFMVGDMKQSIYRFRLADPLIFLSKYNKFAEYSSLDGADKGIKNKNDGVKIHLSKNFRSRAGVLDAVNLIFSNTMSAGFGEMEYTEKEYLIPGRAVSEEKQGKKGKPYLENSVLEEKVCVEVDILDLVDIDKDPEEDNPAAIKIEAEHIARKIKTLIGSKYPVTDDKDGERHLKYSDIVILLRSMKGRAWQFADALTENGVPSELPGSEGYFQTIEISAALSFLAVIDNPLQDIPLAAVLCGLIYRFTSAEIAEIRTGQPDKSLYDALIWSAEQEIESGETVVKCRKTLNDIKDLRAIVADMPSDRFIWHMYNKTELPGLVGSLRGGERRRNNLILLAESARKFESSGYKGLFGFLNYVKSLQEKGYNLAEGFEGKATAFESSDTVKIMSIHKSKGLEFPVVFLANTSKINNFQDSRKNVVFHTALGIGTMLIDKKKRVKYSTLARSAIQSILNDEMLSEELRVMYVAMTRAKDKLIITAALKDAVRTYEKVNALPAGKIAPQAMKSLRNMAEWVLAGKRDSSCSEFTVNIIDAGVLLSEFNNKSMPVARDIRVAKNDTLTLTGAFPTSVNDQVLYDEIETPLYKQAKKLLSALDFAFKYPYEASTVLPSKLTVTGLITQSDPEADKAEWIREQGWKDKTHKKPLLLSGKQKMTAAERGILLHHVMQHIDCKILSDDLNIMGVEKQLQLLGKLGIITNEQIAEVDKVKILGFFNSATGSRMINAEKLYREFKFSLLRPAEAYFPGGGSDEILIQGVVDCFFEEYGEIVVVDFKTDKVTVGNYKEKAQRYAQQLAAYADALYLITGKPVKERIIYFFTINTACIV